MLDTVAPPLIRTVCLSDLSFREICVHVFILLRWMYTFSGNPIELMRNISFAQVAAKLVGGKII